MRWCATAALGLGALLLTGCAPPAIQEGIDSSGEAVTRLLEAAEANDWEAAQRVMTANADEASARRTVLRVRDLMARGGGLDRLTVVEKDRIGNAALVEVLTDDPAVSELFTVSEEPGGFAVIPRDAVGIVDGPTSAPE